MASGEAHPRATTVAILGYVLHAFLLHPMYRFGALSREKLYEV
jgi:hypothetical protein